VNSFRSDLAQKRSLFSLLTDSQVIAKFPAAEKKAIATYVPWTRVMAGGKTDRDGETVDLTEYVQANRESLTLAPNDASAALPSFDGATVDQTAWERAIKQAMRERYVVQDRVNPIMAKFPVLFYGALEYRDVSVEVRPQLFLGELKGCSTYLSSGQGGFSTMEGIAATFILEGK